MIWIIITNLTQIHYMNWSRWPTPLIIFNLNQLVKLKGYVDVIYKLWSILIFILIRSATFIYLYFWRYNFDMLYKLWSILILIRSATFIGLYFWLFIFPSGSLIGLRV